MIVFVCVCVKKRLFAFPVFIFRALGPENLLLKGATLKNTKKIYGKQDTVNAIQCCDMFYPLLLSEDKEMNGYCVHNCFDCGTVNSVSCAVFL